MGETIGILLFAYGPWVIVGGAIVTAGVFVGRALRARNANAAALTALSERVLQLEEQHADAIAAAAQVASVRDFDRQVSAGRSDTPA